jgi:hypothetical protein
MPADPFSGGSDWEEVQSDSGAAVDPNAAPGIWDVRSRAAGAAMDGTPYSQL